MKKIFLILALLFSSISISYSQEGWILQNVGAYSDFHSVYFPSTSTGYIVGWYSTVLKTTNGGINWVQQSLGSSLGLQNVYFITDNEGWIVGQNGTILHTTNGGTNWLSQYSGTSNLLLLSQFLSPQIGYVVGYNGTIMKTTNGGNNWSFQYSGTSINLLSVYFVNSTTGFISGNSGLLMKTTNGGDNWFNLYSGYSYNMGKVQFINNLTGWVSGTNGLILKTTNSGVNWFSQPSGVTNWLITFTFIDQSTGWISGSSGMMLKTTNGGNNWFQQTTNVTNDFRSNFFVNQNTGWAVGMGGIVLRTTNGGAALPNSPLLISPPNNSVVYTLTPNMVWSQVTGATDYQIQISTSNTFSTITDSASLTATNYSVPSGKLTYGSNYYWRVRSRNVAGYSNWSYVWMFTASINLLSPILLYPLNATVVYTNTPQLDWEDCNGALSYHVQVSTSSSFVSLIDSATVNSSSYTIPPGKLFPETYYYWRVKANYAAGQSPWSSVWYFSINPNLILQNTGEIPKEFRLHQNFPNPFNPSTKIKFDIPRSASVKIKIYNSLGQLVEFIFNGTLNAGTYTVNWGAKSFNSGIYFVRFESEKSVFTKRMLLIK